MVLILINIDVRVWINTWSQWQLSSLPDIVYLSVAVIVLLSYLSSFQLVTGQLRDLWSIVLDLYLVAKVLWGHPGNWYFLISLFLLFQGHSTTVKLRVQLSVLKYVLVSAILTECTKTATLCRNYLCHNCSSYIDILY